MTQVTGKVFARLPNGSIGPALADAALEFINEDRSSTFTATSDTQGSYSISLSEAHYYLRATHAGHQDYTSAPGFLSVAGPDQTCNFLLSEPLVTTVIVIRHAEKSSDAIDESVELSDDLGKPRARALARVLFRSGVTRIFRTNTVRSRDTAKPLAEALQLDPTVYAYSPDNPQITQQAAQQAAQDVLQNNRGDVVLVVAHSDSVSTFLTALGVSGSIGSIDFDNMFVVNRAGPAVEVLKLKYGRGEPAPASDRLRDLGSAMTLLMVGVGDQRSLDLVRFSPVVASVRQLAQLITPISPVTQQLIHAASGSTISAIFTMRDQTAMVYPLAALLGITPMSQRHSDLQLLNSLWTASRTGAVVVSGTNANLRNVIGLFRGQLPILYPSDVDHLIVVTRFLSGAVRVLPMRL